MDAVSIHKKIYTGRGKAAKRLGLSYKVYRPNNAESPLSSYICTVNAAFNACDNKYLKPNMPSKAYWFADMDGNLTASGDYLVSECNGIYFVAEQQQLLPILMVECNRSIKLLRQMSDAQILGATDPVGAVGYSGVCASTVNTALGSASDDNSWCDDFGGWSCSILFQGKGDGRSALPLGSMRVGYEILLPVSIPLNIKSGDILMDDMGLRYLVNGAEKTSAGWILHCSEEHI